MELFKDTHIDFLRVKWICIGVSWALIVAGFISIAMRGGLRFGIDFSGGTQIVLKFADRPDPSKIEGILKPLNLGLEGVQRYDTPEKNEVLIKVKQQAREGRDVTQEVFSALSAAMGGPAAGGKMDINTKGHDTFAANLSAADPDNVAGKLGATAAQHYLTAGDAIVAYRSRIGLFRSAADMPSHRLWSLGPLAAQASSLQDGIATEIATGPSRTGRYTPGRRIATHAQIARELGLSRSSRHEAGWPT